jgi:hypothetical protein
MTFPMNGRTLLAVVAHRTARALPPPARAGRLILAITIAGLLSASCDFHNPNEPGFLASLEVLPDVTLPINGTQQFVVIGRDDDGVEIPVSPTWSVVNGGGAINATTGMFQAGTTPGSFGETVKATSGNISATAAVTVVVGPLASITVTPNPDTTVIRTTQQFTAIGRDVGGNAITITPTWSIVAGGGTVSTTGLFTAGSTPGSFSNTVRATSGSVSGNATSVVIAGPAVSLTVTPDPVALAIDGTQQFTAVAVDVAGNVVPAPPVWSVVSGGGAISAGGIFTAGSTPGTFTNTVQATSGTLSGRATVTVLPGALASIVVTPNPSTLPTGGVQQFTAVGRDVSGNVIPIAPTWSVVNGGGTINSSGSFTAGTNPGTFATTVRATSGSVSGNATVIVTPGSLASVLVTPNPATLSPNGTQQFTAVGRDGSGNIVPIAPAWSVVNGGGAINATTGVFTAGPTLGTFTNTVRATIGGNAGHATVIVQSVPTPPFLDLGPNGIIAGTAVSCISGGVINADISISPGMALTGFGPCVYTGTANLGNPVAAQAQLNLTAAYNTLAGLPCNTTIVADLGGQTLLPGVYCHGSGIGLTGTVTLDGNGDPNARFVFQAGSTLTTAGNVVLINGANARNVYWQVGSSATLGTASQFRGNILALTSITLNANATMLGRALARNGAVSLNANNVITLP